MFTLLQLSETDKHNHNSVKRVIQNLKDGLSKISNACGTGVLAYHCEAMEYRCSINNNIAWVCLGNWLPFEAFGGGYARHINDSVQVLGSSVLLELY